MTIDFEYFVSTASGRRATSLLGNKSAVADLYERTFGAVAESAPHVGLGKLRTTEQLCGRGMWINLWTAERRVAGMCLAFQVSLDALPLAVHRTPSGKGKKRYCSPDSLTRGV